MGQVLKMPKVVKKRSRHWDAESRAMVLKLHDSGWNEIQIGRAVKRTRMSVSIELKKLLYYRAKQPKPQVKQKKPKLYAPKTKSISVLTEAEDAMKNLDRSRRHGDCLYLDGKPCTAQRLMVEYSKWLVAQGSPPVCRATECLV